MARRIITHREQAEAAAVLRELYRLSRAPQLGPMTDDEYQAHSQRVQELLAAIPRRYYTTVAHAGPENGWVPQRADQHRQILQNAWRELAEHVPRNRQGLIFGGLPGSGKSTVFGQIQIDGVGPAAGNFARIDPDYFKEELARRGMTPQIEGLSAMETSPLIHEESSYLAQELAKRAFGVGTNVAWDGTLRHPESGPDRVSDFRRHGYTPHGVFVDVALPTSYARATQRHRQAQDALRAAGPSLLVGTSQLGGRVVPTDFIDASKPTSPGYNSINQQNFEAIRPQLATAQTWDNTGQSPRRVYQTARAARRATRHRGSQVRPMHIENYQDAAGAFSRGELTYDDLLAAVALLRPPPLAPDNTPAPDETLNDLYLRAEQQYSKMPPPGSLSWLATLHNFGEITREQYDALLIIISCT